MIVVLTEQEKEWIDMKPFAWSVKLGCPVKLRERIENKLNRLNEFSKKNS